MDFAKMLVLALTRLSHLLSHAWKLIELDSAWDGDSKRYH